MHVDFSDMSSDVRHIVFVLQSFYRAGVGGRGVLWNTLLLIRLSGIQVELILFHHSEALIADI